MTVWWHDTVNTLELQLEHRRPISSNIYLKVVIQHHIAKLTTEIRLHWIILFCLSYLVYLDTYDLMLEQWLK